MNGWWESYWTGLNKQGQGMCIKNNETLRFSSKGSRQILAASIGPLKAYLSSGSVINRHGGAVTQKQSAKRNWSFATGLPVKIRFSKTTFPLP